MFDRLFKRRPAQPPPKPLHGAPPVRRQKTYSAMTGYVYQYFYEGYRETDRAGRRGDEYVFKVSADRKASFPLTVFLPRAAVERWQQDHARDLTQTEQYAAVKMALFEAFDDRADLGPAENEVEVAPTGMERLLSTLEID